MKKKKANWLGHVLSGNCITGNITGGKRYKIREEEEEGEKEFIDDIKNGALG